MKKFSIFDIRLSNYKNPVSTGFFVCFIHNHKKSMHNNIVFFFRDLLDFSICKSCIKIVEYYYEKRKK